MKKLTKEEFIERSKQLYGNMFDYSLVDFKDTKTKVIIKYKNRIFEQMPVSHLKGHNIFHNEIEFIKKSKIKFGDLYDYSLVEYKHRNKLVKIICHIHGIFEQTPRNHISSFGCPICNKNMKLNTLSFIKKSQEIHNNKYDYSLVNYETNKKKIKIICPNHGEFIQTARSHLNGCGCPRCNESKGEKIIRIFLEEHNLNFKMQYRFNNCRNKNTLPFDFYLPSLNVCIEFDGEQHYIPKDYFGGEKRLLETQINDKIKNEYCKENNIRLIRIKYDQKIENILNKNLLI